MDDDKLLKLASSTCPLMPGCKYLNIQNYWVKIGLYPTEINKVIASGYKIEVVGLDGDVLELKYEREVTYENHRY